jgi:integrase
MARLKDGVIKRGNSWSYVIRVTDASGASKPRWVGGFESEEAAKAARDEARVAARRGEYVNRNGVTVGEYLREWLDSHALEVKPKTRAGYEFNIEKYVIPHLGRTRLQTVRPATLSGLYRTLLQEGGKDGGALSVRTVEYVHAVLRKAFNDAVHAEQLLATNPAIRAKRPRSLGAPRTWDGWTGAQLRAFLGGVEEHRLFALFRLAAFTGARRGELLHLRWADLDLDAPPYLVRIRGSVGQVAGARVEGTTKNGRSRTVSIDAETAAIMRKHREAQAEDRRVAGGSWVAGDLVFRRQIGAPLYPDTPTALMAKLLTAHNAAVQAEHDRQAEEEGRDSEPSPDLLPRVRFHDLRHIHATLLLKAGVPVHVVSARLGHSDPAITLRVYAHVLADQAVHAADVFASVVKAPNPGPETPGK